LNGGPKAAKLYGDREIETDGEREEQKEREDQKTKLRVDSLPGE